MAAQREEQSALANTALQLGWLPLTGERANRRVPVDNIIMTPVIPVTGEIQSSQICIAVMGAARNLTKTVSKNKCICHSPSTFSARLLPFKAILRTRTLWNSYYPVGQDNCISPSPGFPKTFYHTSRKGCSFTKQWDPAVQLWPQYPSPSTIMPWRTAISTQHRSTSPKT